MKVTEALSAAAALGLDRLDAQWLLLHALGREPGGAGRAWLLAHCDDVLPADRSEAFLALASRRAAGEPAAYLIGHTEFFGLPLKVDRRVLVPRPDTETLVDWGLAVLDGVAQPRVLDLGTGSGAIALALQHARPDADVLAVDASADALAVARANAAALQLPLRFAHGDWLAALPAAEAPFDLIVSNPPYVADGDAHLAALVHEPQTALTAGADGLADLRTIVATAHARLKSGGWLLLEHGYDQAAAVAALLKSAGFTTICHRTDLAGIDRCTGGFWPTVK